MFELSVQNKRENLLCYYSSREHLSKACEGTSMDKVRMARTVYDYNDSKFVKDRYNNVDLMNMMLEVQRARMNGLITPEMEKLVNEHA